MTRKSAPLERYEQKWLVDWLKVHPVLKKFFYKTNNEGKRTPQQTYFLKQMGLRPGVSDIHVYWPTKTHPGLWLEVKRNMVYPPSARKTDTWIAQEEFLADVRSIGFVGEFCYGWVDGKRIIESYLLT